MAPHQCIVLKKIGAEIENGPASQNFTCEYALKKIGAEIENGPASQNYIEKDCDQNPKWPRIAKFYM